MCTSICPWRVELLCSLGKACRRVQTLQAAGSSHNVSWLFDLRLWVLEQCCCLRKGCLQCVLFYKAQSCCVCHNQELHVPLCVAGEFLACGPMFGIFESELGFLDSGISCTSGCDIHHRYAVSERWIQSSWAVQRLSAQALCLLCAEYRLSQSFLHVLASYSG